MKRFFVLMLSLIFGFVLFWFGIFNIAVGTSNFFFGPTPIALPIGIVCVIASILLTLAGLGKLDAVFSFIFRTPRDERVNSTGKSREEIVESWKNRFSDTTEK